MKTLLSCLVVLAFVGCSMLPPAGPIVSQVEQLKKDLDAKGFPQYNGGDVSGGAE